MKKIIICPECKGRMEFAPYVINGQRHGLKAVPVQCDSCNGTGEIEVPMTNFDYIKGMSLEEMAFLLDGFRACSNCRKNGNNCFPVFNTEEWLNQEYKGD